MIMQSNGQSMTTQERMDGLLFAALLLNRDNPMAPHHVEAIRERLGYPTDKELLEAICDGKPLTPIQQDYDVTEHPSWKVFSQIYIKLYGIPPYYKRREHREFFHWFMQGSTSDPSWQPISTHPASDPKSREFQYMKPVIITDGSYVCTGCYGGGDSGWKTAQGARTLPTPTHWMPLPKPPQI